MLNKRGKIGSPGREEDDLRGGQRDLQTLRPTLQTSPLLAQDEKTTNQTRFITTSNRKHQGFLVTLAMIAIVLQSQLQTVQAQSTYVYQAITTTAIIQDLDFPLGPTKKAEGAAGFELNFWALPFFSTTAARQPILKVCNNININFGFNNTVASNTHMGFGFTLGNFDGFGKSKSLSTTVWNNVNLRVLYGNYTLLNVWQGNNWYELNPFIKVLHKHDASNNVATQSCEMDSTMYIKKTTALVIGAYVGDFRILKINQTDSYGQFLRHYESPFNNRWNYTLNYIFIREGQFNILPSMAGSHFVGTVNVKKIDVLRCNQSMAMQADGSCSMNCLTTKCLFCQTIDKLFYNICRFCDGVSSSCSPISRCPVDYYLENGICYKCPTGCSTCERGDLCNSCDSGLVLNAVKQKQSVTIGGVTEDIIVTLNASCSCPIGQFGTINEALDTVTCDKCDETCYTCAQTNVKCTSCKDPLFWIENDGGICIRTCSDLNPNYYGDPNDRICKPCRSNCNKCKSLNGCTSCGDYQYNKTTLQQDGTNLTVLTNATLLNAEGICVTSCPNNSIDNSTFGMCHMCPSQCTECSFISSNCTKCNNDTALYTFSNKTFTPAKQDGRCLERCPVGFFKDQTGICKQCDESCTVCDALNFCTNCTMNRVSSPNKLYHFVNFQCKLDCGERFYPDQTDYNYYFCRSCPSNCLNCDNARKCTSCINEYYLTTINGYTLCVRPQDCAPGSYPKTTINQGVKNQVCDLCFSNCKTCTNTTDCQECFDGYFLNIGKTAQNVPIYQCLNSCPSGKFALPNGQCENCISNCTECKDTLTCKTCKSDSYLLEDEKICRWTGLATCPSGYYLNTQNNCTKCKPECNTCTSLSVCTSCILGHTLQGNTCGRKCGNGIREDREECDDGNDVSMDGCAPDCTVEDNFVCEQGTKVGLTVFPDICRCDPILTLAEWTDYWGTIRLVFDTMITYNSTTSPKSNIPMTFCNQILQPTTISRLGSSYACYLWIGNQQSELLIDVGRDATIGNKGENYETFIDLIEGAILVKGCALTGIPPRYWVKNLPLDTPQVLISGPTYIGSCSQAVTLNLATSKGLTKRNFEVVWTLISITPANDDLREQMQTTLDQIFVGKSMYTIPKAFVDQLQGKTVRIQVKVKNFLERESRNQTDIIFARNKQLQIIDLPDSITFQISIANSLYPRFRLPYCLSESVDNLQEDYSKVKFSCEMYDQALTTKRWPLFNCTIPANNMTIGATYMVSVTATYDNDPSQNNNKLVVVQPSSPAIQVALIQGCNRLFSPNNSFTLSAIYNTNPKTTTFVWQCTDKATGSVCFSTSYKYITLGNSEIITVSKDIFFYGMQYEFKVTAFDANSGTNSSISCTMYSSQPKDRIIDVLIEGEATKTGFIDFTREQTAFKAFITNMDQVVQSNLKYTWSIKDSSEKMMKPNEVIIYQNSIGVRTQLLNRNSLYYVYVEVTDGVSWGNATQVLQTKPDLSNEFTVEPASLDPRSLTTVWSLSVYGQRTFDTLDQYVFGYVDPKDQITKIPMTQKTYKKSVQFILPDPIGTAQMTCYMEVILPNRVSMTFYQTVTIYPTDMTVQQFNDDIKGSFMDDIVESMQMKHKLVSMRNKMTLTQRSTAIKKILEGLQRETTPLSDYYIQSSVGSLLEYISNENDSLMSDSQIVTVAAQIFRQMTIGENVDLANGKSLQFGKSVTSQLYNFANNLFMKDFTNLIGGQPQLEMKVMFMQGLKNVLKGSLSNMILGDVGGFSYQGQNIFAKAVKFDQLENQYLINSTLPKSVVKNFTTQNFVNISLPKTANNPCKKFTACQVSIIILDTPITRFISNSKDSSLKSMLVDMSIQETEVSSPYSYIQIKDAVVEGLSDPILVTIPLYSELNKTNPNNTLGCGFIDTQDNVFKQTGYQTTIITNSLVTCRANHLTTIGVEEYAAEIKSTATTEEDKKTTTSSSEDGTTKTIIINMWDCWALYACFSLIGVLLLAILWARRRDLQDEKDLLALQKKQKRIYVNLFLEPIQEKQVKEDTSFIPEKKSYVDVYQKVEVNDESMKIGTMAAGQDQSAKSVSASNQKMKPNDSFFKESQKVGPSSPAKSAKDFGVDFADDAKSSKSSKSKKSAKGKKKKKKNANPNDDFFNEENDNIEKELFFEGGDDDDFFGNDDGNQSQPSKKKKKKKKSKPALDTGLNSGPTHTPFVIGGDEGVQEERTGGRTKRGKSVEREEEQDFGGFNFKVDADEEDRTSKKSKGEQSSQKKTVKKKKKKTTSRSKSINSNKSQEDEDRNNALSFFHANPDAEAQMIKPGKNAEANSKFQSIPLEDFDGPDAKKMNQDEVQKLRKEIESGMEDIDRQDTQSKGFETLMNEELEKQKSEMGRHKKKKAQAKKRQDEVEKKKKQKKGEYYEKETANCVQFCIWNCKEANRCTQLCGKYNQFLSRPSRIILLVGSWFVFIMLTGFLVEGPKFVDQKAEKVEQFVCGTIAAVISRVWVVLITAFLIHSKQEKVYQEIYEVTRAKRTVCLNTIRYYFGLFLVLITVIIVISQVFAFAARFAPALVMAWAWTTIFAFLADLVVADGLFIIAATLVTMTVGAAPDACGKFRNLILGMVPEAIRNAAQ